VAKRIVVNAGLTETRVAVQEGNLLTELYVERARHRSIVGSVYKGVVTNVLPGMQAAFVDIGLAKDAFLYAGDYTADLGAPPETAPLSALSADPLDEAGEPTAVLVDPDTLDQAAEAGATAATARNGDAASTEETEADDVPPPRREPIRPIEEVLRKGQEVLVQVAKEPLGTKGARVTAFISIPGRYLVYMPQSRHIGVSRRIRDDDERDRLRATVRELAADSGGFIVRTNAEGKGEDEFRSDVEFLRRLWQQILSRQTSAPAPSVLHEEGDLTFRVVRDLLSPDVEEFVVDTPEVYEKCRGYVETLVPGLADKVRLWDEPTPVFEALGIEKEIEKALRRRVWLKSGGYIVIDHTEALVSIDVNSGKYVGKRDFEQTVLKINMEAVGEVVRQIRLRDLGGIIIIDFIDMESAEHREQVYRALKRALAEDKARTNVLEISELGLVEMTRKRVRQDLRALLSQQCPTCRGSGVTKSDETLAAELFRAVRAKAASAPGKDITARVHPDVAAHLDAHAREDVDRLAALIGARVTVEPFRQPKAREDYELIVRG
jgi:ribonuclease G